MAANRINSLQNLVLGGCIPTHVIAKQYHYTKHLNLCNACCKCENILGAVILPGALVGKNGDPPTGWMKEGILEQRGCSFQVDNQLSTIQGLICIVLDVAMPNISGVTANAFPIRGIQDLR